MSAGWLSAIEFSGAADKVVTPDPGVVEFIVIFLIVSAVYGCWWYTHAYYRSGRDFE